MTRADFYYHEERSTKQYLMIGAMVFTLLIGTPIMIALKSYFAKPPVPVVAENILSIPKIPDYIPIEEDINVAMNDDGGNHHHLNVAVTIQTRDQDLSTEIKKYQPLIVNDLLALFGTQDYLVLINPSEKTLLREKALKIVKSIMKEQTGDDAIDSVLFTKFVMD